MAAYRCRNGILRCGEPLYQYVRPDKRIVNSYAETTSVDATRSSWPIGNYIYQKYRYQLDFLVVDEAHRFKSDSNRGFAFSALINASKKQLFLSGTFFDGKASGLFHLLYRSNPRFAKQYSDKAKRGTKRHRGHYVPSVREYVKRYGINAITETTVKEVSATSGQSKVNITSKESAGFMPELHEWILPNMVFLQATDMPHQLPSYNDKIEVVEMTGEMEKEYEQFEASIREKLRDSLTRGSKALLFTLQKLLEWTDAPHRETIIEHPHDKVQKTNGEIVPIVIASARSVFDKVGESPKDIAILNNIIQDIADGRKSILLLEQTMKRDLRGEWVELLAQHGIQAFTVGNSSAAGRKKHIMREMKKGGQVLITHAKSIEVGVDLVQFSRLHVMQHNNSTQTMMQVKKRIHRIGQLEECEATYYVYSETFQVPHLRMNASKIAASDGFYGNLPKPNSMAARYANSSIDTSMQMARMLIDGDDTSGESITNIYNQLNEEVVSGSQMLDGASLADMFDDLDSSGVDSVIGSEQLVYSTTEDETDPQLLDEVMDALLVDFSGVDNVISSEQLVELDLFDKYKNATRPEEMQTGIEAGHNHIRTMLKRDAAEAYAIWWRENWILSEKPNAKMSKQQLRVLKQLNNKTISFKCRWSRIETWNSQLGKLAKRYRKYANVTKRRNQRTPVVESSPVVVSSWKQVSLF